MTPRPLHTYRPQHDEDCESRTCNHCGTSQAICDLHADGHAFEPMPCTCGLDLALVRSEGEPTGWKPIETAPRNRIKLYEQRAIGGWWHKVYGWLWGQLDFHPDKHHDDGGYFLVKGGAPTHWTTLLAPPAPSGRQEP